MNAPAQPIQQRRPTFRSRAAAGDGLSRFLFFVGAVLFVIGAFSAGGDALASITVLPWWGGAFAACALAVAV